VFFAIFGCQAHFKDELRQKWLKIDQDNLRTGTAKAVARFMSFAQITCYFTGLGKLITILGPCSCFWELEEGKEKGENERRAERLKGKKNKVKTERKRSALEWCLRPGVYKRRRRRRRRR